MTEIFWIVGISLFFIIGFIAVVFSQLRANRETDKHIDYSKLRPVRDDEDDDEK